MLDLICCPSCHGNLTESERSLRCASCLLQYPEAADGQYDLRLRRPKTVSMRFTFGISPISSLRDEDMTLDAGDSPKVSMSGIHFPNDVKDLLNYLPSPDNNEATVLDLGSGRTHLKPVFNELGYRYVGIDYNNPNADLLGDAQALPFSDNSFQCVWTSSVMQYVPFGFAMIKEIERVLAPGGILLGTVAFLEAYDGSSYNMYTFKGINSLLTYGGFRIRKLAPDGWWTAPVAVSVMGLFPRMPMGVARGVANVVEPLSRAWWRVGSWKDRRAYSDVDRLNRTTAHFSFVAEKPAVAGPPAPADGPSR
jgi:SAM-dependent methyltransferase